MSDKTISQLPAASDTDVGSSASYDIPVVVNGTTKKVSNSQVLAPVRQELQSTASQVTQLSTKVGDLSDLETTDKSSIVNAINEARQSGGGGGGSSVSVVNNLTSTSTTSALSANMGKTLNDTLTNLTNWVGTAENLTISDVTTIVAALNKLKALIDASAPENSLISTSTTKPLSAAQGKALKGQIDDILGSLGTIGETPVADDLGNIHDILGDCDTLVSVYNDIAGAIDNIAGRVQTIEAGGSGGGVSAPTEVTLSGSSLTISTLNYNSVYILSSAVSTLEISAFGTANVNNETTIYMTTADSGDISVTFPSGTKFVPMKTIFRNNTEYVISVVRGHVSICVVS